MRESSATEAWGAFVKAARYVRANPQFDDQRRHKLEVADVVRELIGKAKRGESIRADVHALLELLWNPCAPLILPFHSRWLEDWAASDEPSLARVVAWFSDVEEEAFNRFRRFNDAVKDAIAAGEVESVPRLFLGSLLNFALEPQRLPIVRRLPFEHLERRLGHQSSGRVTDRYESHVAFADDLGRRLGEAGVEVRDMLDIQELIFRNFDQVEPEDWLFWAPEPQDPRAREVSRERSRNADGGRMPYLSVSACLGFVRSYLLEWIEFHRLVGVERFFLYNNQDREANRELLLPYVEEGVVVLYEWPQMPAQNSAADHCVTHHRHDSRWIAFIDADEFLFSRTGRSVPEILVDYEGWPGVGVNWILFGPSGHRTKPSGLTIESYQRWLPQPHRKMIKTIVDPTRALYSPDPHVFVYDRGKTVDENHYPIDFASTSYLSTARLQLNHYFTRSEEELRAKQMTLNASRGTLRPPIDFERLVLEEELYGLTDTAILRYAPALRKAVDAAESRSGVRAEQAPT